MPTLKALYAAKTGDHETHQRTIGAHFARLPKRRQRIIRLRLQGLTLYTIAQAEGVSHAAIASVIDDAMLRIHKEVTGMPRYHKSGRGSWK